MVQSPPGRTVLVSESKNGSSRNGKRYGARSRQVKWVSSHGIPVSSHITCALIISNSTTFTAQRAFATDSDDYLSIPLIVGADGDSVLCSVGTYQAALAASKKRKGKKRKAPSPPSSHDDAAAAPRKKVAVDVKYHPLLQARDPHAPAPAAQNDTHHFHGYRLVSPGAVPRGGRELYQMPVDDDNWNLPGIQVLQGPGQPNQEGDSRTGVRQGKAPVQRGAPAQLDPSAFKKEVRAYRGEFGRSHRPPRPTRPAPSMAAGFYERQNDPPSARRPTTRVVHAEHGPRHTTARTLPAEPAPRRLATRPLHAEPTVRPPTARGLPAEPAPCRQTHVRPVDPLAPRPATRVVPAEPVVQYPSPLYYMQRYIRDDQAGPSNEVFLEEGYEDAEEEDTYDEAY